MVSVSTCSSCHRVFLTAKDRIWVQVGNLEYERILEGMCGTAGGSEMGATRINQGRLIIVINNPTFQRLHTVQVSRLVVVVVAVV